MDTVTSGIQRKVSPWDKWSKDKGREYTWHAMRALKLAWNKNLFLDLGAGYGRNSLFLLENGFEQGVGIDKYPVPAEISCDFNPFQFSFVESTIEQFTIPSDSFGAIIAAHSLYLCDKEKLPCIFEGILNGLCPGGIFAGNLLDVSDPYSKGAPIPVSLVDACEVRNLVRGFRVIEHRQTVVQNGKKWHNHNLVLEKL